ncbi:SRPBCC family protein [Iamia sp. SCSIO 61187]|uniref:SRPBCC family protein n=1 Tax=Iamia sp. SCSIO 61187 TaxID=2722752 RepID=UPI001C6290CC|nr:SRPBCC family protein [Iamia sp. SCSIO 61187]QYG91883.1 SRPBCC family protein [Iamia sp. SCSIO 61187]
MAPPGMREVTTDLPVGAAVAWAVLSDPTTYPRWLVGAVEILSVDEAWPEPGTSFRHRVGLGGPITTQDSTTVKAVDEPRSLVLEARARPFGRAHVEIEVRPAGAGCEVAMREGMLSPLTPLTPMAQPLITARNKESLRRLSEMPELGGGS